MNFNCYHLSILAITNTVDVLMWIYLSF